jgi:hypothetical protein
MKKNSYLAPTRRIFFNRFWGREKRREEKRREKFFCLETQLLSKRRGELYKVALKKVIFFSSLINVIVRERNDTFLYLSRETVSVLY